MQGCAPFIVKGTRLLRRQQQRPERRAARRADRDGSGAAQAGLSIEQ
jgi:hypothetical protein